MSVSRIITPGTGGQNFNLALGSAYSDVTFDSERSAGEYVITSSGEDATLDIYAYSAAGNIVGYTGTKALSVSSNFTRMVVIGGVSGDVLGFEYKLTFETASENNDPTAPPFITSISTTTFPNTSTTAVVTGGNFTSTTTVTFTSTSTATVYTGTSTYSSNTSITVGRPSTLPASYSPYILKLSNVDVNDPVGSNANKITVNAGSDPVITSPSTISYTTNASTTITLTATDADVTNTGFTWAVVSGTLPSGLSLNTATGALSGTPTTSQQTVTFSVTDGGNNTVNKAIKFNANPVWTTAAGTLTSGEIGAAYSVQLAATDDNGSLTYTLTSGTLPTGLTVSSTGLISGTPSAGNGNTSFTVTVTDIDGGSTARAFNIPIVVTTTFTSSQTWTAPTGVTSLTNLVVGGGGASGGGNYDSSSTVGSGGGGAGGVVTATNVSVTPGTGYSIVIGAGGAGMSGANRGNNGVNSTAFGYTGNGGGGGGGNNQSGNSGGCGGGGARQPGGAGNQGFNGSNGNGDYQNSGGAGGGMGSAGVINPSNTVGGAGGSGATYLGITIAGGGGGGGAGTGGAGGSGGGTNGGTNTGGSSSAGANTCSGSGGAMGAPSGNGGSGRIIIRYNG